MYLVYLYNANITGCYSTATGVWSPGKVDVDDCGRQFVPFVAQQQQQVRPPNSAYVDVTAAAVRYGVAPPYEPTVGTSILFRHQPSHLKERSQVK